MNKRLTKSKRDRQISGVCGGLAEYFNIDATLVRLIFIVGSLMGGPGLIIYIILAIVMPEGDGLVDIEKPKNDDTL